MRKTLVVCAASFVAAAVLAGCGQSDEDATAELQETIRQAHEFDSGYDLLGEVAYRDGTVTVNSEPVADAMYGAINFCNWVSGWLYERDGADAQVVVNVPGRNGSDDFALVRRGQSEDCSDAAYNSR